MNRLYRIMVIDDEPMVVKGLTSIVPWHEIGCEVVGVAEDGEEGLLKIESLKPDIVISDIQMPKLSGLKMIEAMKKVHLQTKFIIMTGYRQFEYAQQAIDLGVEKFLLKPTNIEQIKGAVVEVTNKLDLELEREEDYDALKKRLATYEIKETTLEENNLAIEDGLENMNHLGKQALAYIKDHYYDKIDLQSLADHLQISTWYVCKLFKQEMGTNFVDVLNEVRIQEAKRLLKESTLKVYEICEEVGFHDTPYFTKTFKRYVGVTPNKYRNNE